MFMVCVCISPSMTLVRLFQAYGLTFRPILERFEKLDGLRRLYNYVCPASNFQAYMQF